MEGRKTDTTTTASISRLFNSVSPEQKVLALIAEVDVYKKRLQRDPGNELFKNQFIKLNFECGNLFLANQQYVEAEPYFEAAVKVADCHHLKSCISAKLLIIKEEFIFASIVKAKNGM